MKRHLQVMHLCGKYIFKPYHFQPGQKNNKCPPQIPYPFRPSEPKVSSWEVVQRPWLAPTMLARRHPRHWVRPVRPGGCGRSVDPTWTRAPFQAALVVVSWQVGDVTLEVFHWRLRVFKPYRQKTKRTKIHDMWEKFFLEGYGIDGSQELTASLSQLKRGSLMPPIVPPVFWPCPLSRQQRKSYWELRRTLASLA